MSRVCVYLCVCVCVCVCVLKIHLPDVPVDRSKVTAAALIVVIIIITAGVRTTARNQIETRIIEAWARVSWNARASTSDTNSE